MRTLSDRRGLRDAVLLVVTTGLAWAQATAQLNGRVADESGAVLPGVTVTVTQTDTGFTRTVVTEGDGAYVMPNLPTGPYRLEVSLQGFRTYVQTGIVLQVGATPTINVALGLGGLEETVSVEAASAARGCAERGHQRGRRAGSDRRASASGAAGDRPHRARRRGREHRDCQRPVAGCPGRWRSRSQADCASGVSYTLDGAMHNNTYDNQNMPLPFPDALQEFSVSTGGLSASSGVHAVASVNGVTKSGTNQFSGNLFEFFRDERFNAPTISPLWGRTVRSWATPCAAISSAERWAGRSSRTSSSSSARTRGRGWWRSQPETSRLCPRRR